MIGLGARFKVGNRVAALSNTRWDDDLDDCTESERSILLLHGHHGRVVAQCETPGCRASTVGHIVHVRWEGVHDGRHGPTTWIDGTAWHMYDYEIEHID